MLLYLWGFRFWGFGFWVLGFRVLDFGFWVESLWLGVQVLLLRFVGGIVSLSSMALIALAQRSLPVPQFHAGCTESGRVRAKLCSATSR